jgi:hypothetical protein
MKDFLKLLAIILLVGAVVLLGLYLAALYVGNMK